MATDVGEREGSCAMKENVRHDYFINAHCEVCREQPCMMQTCRLERMTMW
jgi:hypothetical protein